MFPASKYTVSTPSPPSHGAGGATYPAIPPTPMTMTLTNSSSMFLPVNKMDQTLTDDIEAFIAKIKRGRFIPKQEQSMSMVCAQQATELLRTVVDYYGRTVARVLRDQVIEAESSARKMGTCKRYYRQRLHERAQEIIAQVSSAGRQLQRSSAFRILLANTTRRVLAIIREALVTATITEQEFDEHYKSILDEAKQLRKPSARSQQRPTGDLECDQYSSHGEDGDNSEGDSSDQEDAEEWGYDSFALKAAAAAATGKDVSDEYSMMPLTPEVNTHGTPPTDGHLLPRVSSSAATELQRARSKLRKPVNFAVFYETISNGITELIEEEYHTMTSQIIAHAPLHVYSGELIVAYGCNHSIMSFLTAAAEAKSFLVLILEGAPRGGAATLASALAERGIGCRIVPDSSCFAVMSRASKVFLGTEAVLANGGLLAPIGTHMVCLAAQHHAVPVVVLTTSLKLCPYYPSDRYCTGLVKISPQEAKEMPWSTYGSPHDVLPIESLFQSTDDSRNCLEVNNPMMEYCPPNLLSLFVTDLGEYPPEDINRVVRDHYNAEDTHL